ncbi:fasciclin domain-containing protein [Qipengyuania spongiae]|uniref:Fasciclin domain-containing protein n=1 Tax=Qipengyuania spongiae TaxID=2909673 RepID=A0ABY5SZB9_9SPHN|nr:fasciclin domain-containing protein [Qipengyuania spongiae]UVI38346.1 fasciclin domain-containing protein [Qipengyuania spongiae]
MTNFFKIAAASAAALALTACETTMSDDGDMAMDNTASANTTGSANAGVTVGGAAMSPNRTIVQNASQASNLTTLVTAVQAAGLAETLSGPGPFTVFAPTNAAFDKVPAATRTSLMQPANRAMLRDVLTYHVVPGTLTAADLMQRIRAGNGTATLTTVEGGQLTLRMMGDRIMISGMNGSTAHVTQGDVRQSNGVVHVIDGVLTPSM